MSERFRLRLFAEGKIGIPAVVEEHEHGFDAVFVRNGEIGFHASEESRGVLFPKQIVQKDAHNAHADRLRPAEFAVDCGGIKRFRLPHFQLIDRGARREVAAEPPLSVPVKCFCHDFPSFFRLRLYGYGKLQPGLEKGKWKTMHYSCKIMRIMRMFRYFPFLAECSFSRSLREG